jgi:tetratricopeptide (TPR) repeat protein
MTTTTAALACAVVAIVSAQQLNDLRKMYDAGKYQQALSAAQKVDSEPRVVYLEGQAQQKLTRADAARDAYQRLAQRPDDDAWHWIGQSAVDLLGSNVDGAVNAAGEAVSRDGELPEAHFQRGLALAKKNDMGGAAAAFQKAADLDPTWADAHYYAGLAYSKVKRIDLMAQHFNLFLKLAPQSPQRAEVASIMKALGG